MNDTEKRRKLFVLIKARDYLVRNKVTCTGSLFSCPGYYTKYFERGKWTCSDCFDAFSFINGYRLANEWSLPEYRNSTTYRNLMGTICPCDNVIQGLINGEEFRLAVDELIEKLM